mmetsp:Transcript_11453/g.13127  ORF Transcript_11453/g.13127 Transcript_11453/m.13127 type:complete len:466 (-) Transcript_11453:247-1644(-)
MDKMNDFGKLYQAFSALTGQLSSIENFLAVFGLVDLPMAQRYGILFGIVVFVLTVSSVIALLVLGGSFQRIIDQEQTGEIAASDPVTSRSERNLLYERLLEARDRMMTENYSAPVTTTGMTKLMTMLLNLPVSAGEDLPDLIDNDAAKRSKQRSLVPHGYEKNYIDAYRVCQEKPGGATLSGRPEARFEAYARSFAGCGDYATRDYRRSYARIYEYMACLSHGTDDKYKALYVTRAEDLIGRLVRLEALETGRHAKEFFNLSSGETYLEHKSYDSKEVWGFLNYGPFKDVNEMKKCPIFQRRLNEAAFAIIESTSNRMIGVVLLVNDDSQNLSISIEAPIVMPSLEGSEESIEACFMIMDKLFAVGYRRIQLALDDQDSLKKKFAGQLGFTKEVTIPKHMVIKDANRDSAIYSMLNSDWKKGARSYIIKKIHGTKMEKFDVKNNKKESEREFQAQFLVEKLENNK